jgi:hypothetical protein
MEPIRVRCRSCGKEVESSSGKSVTCGCSNMVTISGDVISANDMTKVVMLSTGSNRKPSSLFTRDELSWQEARNNRKVRKLDFDIR